MFVALEFNDGGHCGVLLTGLGKSSCFLHLNGSSYPRKPYAITGEYAVNGVVTSRILIPSIEDGNVTGVSEKHALLYWKYYKLRTYYTHRDLWTDTDDKNVPKTGRLRAFNAKYSHENHNCAFFAFRLLVAAAMYAEPQRLFSEWDLTHVRRLLKTPGWFIGRARKVRDRILAGFGHSNPIYGYKMENLEDIRNRVTYIPSNNLLDGQVDLPANSVLFGSRLNFDLDPHSPHGVHEQSTAVPVPTAPPGLQYPTNLGTDAHSRFRWLEDQFRKFQWLPNPLVSLWKADSFAP